MTLAFPNFGTKKTSPPVNANQVTLLVQGNPVTGGWTALATPGAGLGTVYVQFDVDGAYYRTDTTDPFYLVADNGALATFGAGFHKVVATATTTGGTVLAVSAPLEVWEGAAPPTPTFSPLFPSDAIWHQRCDSQALHASSAQWMDVLNGHTGHPLKEEFGSALYQGRYVGIPVNILSSNGVTNRTVTLTTYASESDAIPGNVLPIPSSVLIESDPAAFDAGNDNHLVWVDPFTHTLHEFFGMQRSGSNYIAKFHGQWNYLSNALRTNGFTSADAAGLPIAPLLVRYDEALYAAWSGGVIPHALRFTLALTHGPYFWPARHDANTGGTLNPPYGMRVRLKATFDETGFPPITRAILRTMKQYGMYLADTGGDWFITGDYDPRWNDADIQTLRSIVPLGNFEVVDDASRMVDVNSAQTGTGLSLTNVGTGLSQVVTVQRTGQFRLVFEAADNWGLSQWYDLVNDPGMTVNVIGPANGVNPDITVSEPGLFQMVFYGFTPDDCKAYTRSAYYYFPSSARSFTIVENTSTRVILTAVSHPMAGSSNLLTDVTNTVTYYIYPNGKIYVNSVTSSVLGQTSTTMFCGIMGLNDPTQTGTAPPDTRGWVRASTTQNPYTFVTPPETYVFAYWHPSTPSPYTTYTKASVLLVPKTGNPGQGKQIVHSWTNFVRWGYGNGTFTITPGGSVTQAYLIQLGAQNSTVLPDITTAAVAGPIATAYLADPTPP